VHELHPLDVADDGDSHARSLTLDRRSALEQMMETVSLPPFERFYEENRDAIYAHLRRVVGSNAADDAFQETFLRALRGYPKLRHGEHLRAWAFTIAARVAIDLGRRSKPTVELVDELGGGSDSRPAYAELEHLAGELPGKERAAVILRYGYDLPYSDIAAALDSSEEAARAAASSGVRRLRRKLL
jgi:RNA polymerase sigma factor (sigma-70 family)